MNAEDNTEEQLEPVWCVVGNTIAARPYGQGGQETRDGTKHFRSRTRVYIIDWYPGMCESVVAIGLHRKSRKYIKVVVKAWHIRNFRVKLAYQPKVVEIARAHFEQAGICQMKVRAEEMCKALPLWIAEEERRKKRRVGWISRIFRR